jgi:hypothetical protein
MCAVNANKEQLLWLLGGMALAALLLVLLLAYMFLWGNTPHLFALLAG